MGDAGRFRQVLIYLEGDGIRFAPSGRLDVRLEGTRDDRDATLTINVSDNGPGMDAETQRRRFAKDHTTVGTLAGGGHGISMAKPLAELMRGKLEVNSLLGEGTTFVFTVRLKVAEGLEATESAARSTLDGQRALLVDNSAEETHVTRELLRSFGMRVETTTTAEEAIGHLRRAAADGDPVEIAMIDRQAVGEQGDRRWCGPCRVCGRAAWTCGRPRRCASPASTPWRCRRPSSPAWSAWRAPRRRSTGSRSPRSRRLRSPGAGAVNQVMQ